MKRNQTSRVHQEARKNLFLDDAELSTALIPLHAWTEGRKSLIVTTPTVHRLYADSIAPHLRGRKASFLILDCRESEKNLAQVERVCRRALSIQLSRTDLLIGLGGGVCTDITTVAAAWLRRGIEHVRVPTTLIGQVDAGIGYKGAVNLDDHKSYLGVFHAPRNVLVAPRFLHSLPERALRDGFAEIIKIAMVRDGELFNIVERHAEQLIRTSFRPVAAEGVGIIWRAIENMLEELDKNPYEDQTYRRLVDFGHTFSPLLESTSHYRLSHGEAVAIDMALSTAIAAELGLLAPALRDRVLSVIASLGLPVSSSLLTLSICKQSLSRTVLHRGGSVNLVLPDGVGTARFLSSGRIITEEVFAKALQVLEAHQEEACRETAAMGVDDWAGTSGS